MNQFIEQLLPPNHLRQEEFDFPTEPWIFDALLFMDFYEKNNNVYAILGSSNINGTYWEGSTLYFNDLNKLTTSLDYSKYYRNSSTTDGKLLDEKTIVIAEATDNLKVLYTSDDTTNILKTINNLQLPGQITEIACWQNDYNVIIASGCTVSTWNVECDKISPGFKADDVHLNRINSVDSTNDTSMFVTASSDRKACLWDIRCNKPTVLYSNEFSGLTKIRTNKQNSNYYAIGTRAGSIYIIDKRKSPDFLTYSDCFNAPIECLSFNSDNGNNTIAVASGYGNNCVKVLELKNEQLIKTYENTEHKNAVKDLKWFNNDLYSCGYEKQLIKHKI